VVLVFLGNHCPVVKAYEDRLIEFTAAYKDKGVKVVGVSVNDRDDDRIPAIKDYMKDHKSNYIYGYDESQKVGHAYGATNTPQFFVFDKERKIRYLGAMDDSQTEAKVKKTYLKDAVEALLKGETPAVEETRPQGCGVVYKKS
jgi:thiol-disulfide isomerase/thioredoxin